MVSLDTIIGGKEQSSQGKGWMVSLIVHLVICALLYLPIIVSHIPPPEEEGVAISLDLPIPPPEEEGAAKSLGLPDQGQGDEAPSSQYQPKQAEEDQPKEIVSSKPSKQITSQVVTSNEQDAVRVREAQAKKQAQDDAQRRAAEESQKKEAYNKTKKSYGDLLGGNGKGNTGKPGSQGDPNGDPNASALEGISKGSGRVGGGLGNRGVLHEPQINDRSQKTGRVVINVCVDKNGKVIKADYTQKGSTTTDSDLKDIARKAALKFEFTLSEIEEQCGTITVDFKVRG